MKVGQSFIVLNTLSKQSSSLLADIVVVEEQLCEETLVLERLRQRWNARLCHSSVGKSDDTKGLYVCKTFCDFSEAFISDWIIVQVKLAKLELIGEHFSKSRGTRTGYFIAFQMEGQKSIVVFESFAQSNCTIISDIVVLKANFL